MNNYFRHVESIWSIVTLGMNVYIFSHYIDNNMLFIVVVIINIFYCVYGKIFKQKPTVCGSF